MKWRVSILIVAILSLAGGAAMGQPPTPSASAPTDFASARPEPSPPATAEPRPAARPRPAAIDRSTPRQAVLGFLRAVESGDPARAAQVLDLRGLRWDVQSPAEAATQLAAVLNQHVWLRPESISDVPVGTPEDGEDVERIATVNAGGSDVPVTLTRVRRDGIALWLFSEATVARIPELHAAFGTDSWIQPLVPKQLESLRVGGLWGWQWLGLLLALVVGFPIGFGAATLLLAVLMRLARSTSAKWDNAAVSAARRPAQIGLGWAGFGIVALSLNLPGRAAHVLRPIVAIPIILTTGWVIVATVRAVIDVYIAEVPHDEELNTRGVRTQLVIIRRLTTVAVSLVTMAVALMQFSVVRNIGWSLLASAGVAGVVLGFAAQRSLGAVVAGIQLSLTQPIRLGDAVVFEGQWGVVEEITLTWVRLKLFDERRLVVPADKFLTVPFENWSKPGNEMIGLIELAVDPTTPVAEVRRELERLAAQHPAHDGRQCLLQLVDVNEHRALLRARVSTSDVGAVFAMRCELREALMEYLQRLDGGRYLARQRWQDVEPNPRAA